MKNWWVALSLLVGLGAMLATSPAPTYDYSGEYQVPRLEVELSPARPSASIELIVDHVQPFPNGEFAAGYSAAVRAEFEASSPESWVLVSVAQESLTIGQPSLVSSDPVAVLTEYERTLDPRFAGKCKLPLSSEEPCRSRFRLNLALERASSTVRARIDVRVSARVRKSGPEDATVELPFEVVVSQP